MREKIPHRIDKSALDEANIITSAKERVLDRYGYLPIFGALALGGLIASHESPAEALEVTPGMKWEEGLHALRDDVFSSPVEQAAYVAVKKNGEAYWTGSTQGDKTIVRQNAANLTATIEKEIAEKSLESFCQFHTHPILSAAHAKMITAEEGERAIQLKQSTLSLPPSGADVNPFQFGDLSINTTLEKAGAYDVHVVLDPTRVWKHRMATDEDFKRLDPAYWAQIEERRAFYPQWIAFMKDRLGKFSDDELDRLRPLLSKGEQDSIIFWERNKKDSTSEEMGDVKRRAIRIDLAYGNKKLRDEIFKSDPEAQAILVQVDVYDEVDKAKNKKWDEIVYDQWVPFSRHAMPSAAMEDELKKAYLHSGTVLESFTYEQAARDPLAVCTWPERRQK